MDLAGFYMESFRMFDLLSTLDLNVVGFYLLLYLKAFRAPFNFVPQYWS